MSSTKEPALPVAAIYENLGFEESSPLYRSFKATCHAWTESYKKKSGIQESHLSKWKSPSVRHELHKMGESFLMDHGFEYWPPQTDNVAKLQFPCHEDRIIELLEQLFWRFNFNTYRYHKYVRKNGSGEQESMASYDSSVSTLERTPGRSNAIDIHTRPITIPERRDYPVGESVTPSNNISIASSAAKDSDVSPTIGSLADVREAGWLPVGANAQTTAPKKDKCLSAPLDKQPIVKLKIHSLATIDEGSSNPRRFFCNETKNHDDRTRNLSCNDTSVDTEHVHQKRKLTHAEASSPKRMTHAIPAKGLRSSARKRTQNPRYADGTYNVDTTDSDDSETIDGPETRLRRRRKVVQEPSAISTRNSRPGSSQQQALSRDTKEVPLCSIGGLVAKEMDTTTLASGSAPHEVSSDSDTIPRVAPTAVMISSPLEKSGLRVSVPVTTDVSKPPPNETDYPHIVIPPPNVQCNPLLIEDGGEQKTRSVPQVGTKPPTSRPKIRVEYNLIKAREPCLFLLEWEDGKFAGRSLQSVIESISNIVGRGQIESLICTLYTPDINRQITIRKDAETKFENMKRQYSEIMVSSYRKFGQEKAFEIQIEPTYGDVGRNKPSLDVEIVDMDEW